MLASHADGRLWLAACASNRTPGAPPAADRNSDGARSFLLLQLFEEPIIASLRAALWPASQSGVFEGDTRKSIYLEVPSEVSSVGSSSSTHCTGTPGEAAQHLSRSGSADAVRSK